MRHSNNKHENVARSRPGSNTDNMLHLLTLGRFLLHVRSSEVAVDQGRLTTTDGAKDALQQGTVVSLDRYNNLSQNETGGGGGIQQDLNIVFISKHERDCLFGKVS